MCVIIVKKNNFNLTRKELKRNWDGNPDGGGFMFASQGVLHVIKGLFSFRHFYKIFRKYENCYPKADFVIHMRVATSGKRNHENCHPFYINDNLAFSHNGIFSGLGDKDHSDTYQLNEEIFKKLPDDFMVIKEIVDAVIDYVEGSGSKIVLKDNKGAITIVNEAAGKWDEGIWYSSGHYTPIYTSRTTAKNASLSLNGCNEYDNNSDIISGATIDGERYCHFCNTWLDSRYDINYSYGAVYCGICGEWLASEDESVLDYLRG